MAVVDARIRVLTYDPVAQLESLTDWLSAEPELQSKIRLTGAAPNQSELGGLRDVLMIALGSGGAISVLATSLKGWLSHPRRSDVRLEVSGRRGSTVVLDAKRVKVDELADLLRQILSD